MKDIMAIGLRPFKCLFESICTLANMLGFCKILHTPNVKTIMKPCDCCQKLLFKLKYN